MKSKLKSTSSKGPSANGTPAAECGVAHRAARHATVDESCDSRVGTEPARQQSAADYALAVDLICNGMPPTLAHQIVDSLRCLLHGAPTSTSTVLATPSLPVIRADGRFVDSLQLIEVPAESGAEAAAETTMVAMKASRKAQPGRHAEPEAPPRQGNQWTVGGGVEVTFTSYYPLDFDGAGDSVAPDAAALQPAPGPNRLTWVTRSGAISASRADDDETVAQLVQVMAEDSARPSRTTGNRKARNRAPRTRRT